MNAMCTVRLSRNDFGQILDGLSARAEAWRETADFEESAYAGRDDFIAEQCSGADEARRIAADYERIIDAIRAQLPRGEDAS